MATTLRAMTRAELRRALAAAVAAGRLAPDEVAAFLAAFDAGALAAEAVPAVVQAAAGDVSAAAWTALLLLQGDGGAYTLVGGDGLAGTPERYRLRAIEGPQRRRLLRRLLTMTERQRGQFTVVLAEGFDGAAWQLAARLSGYARPGFRSPGPPLTVRAWHRAFAERLRDEFVLEAELALGRPLRGSDLRLLTGPLGEQLGYLDRFAAEVAAREHAGRAFSLRYVAERSRMYEGAARAAHYAIAEARIEDERGPGWVVDVEGADDELTCGPCHAGVAGAPYLPGEGFMPGRDCKGRGKCRHRRVPRYDADAYARLGGRRAA